MKGVCGPRLSRRSLLGSVPLLWASALWAQEQGALQPTPEAPPTPSVNPALEALQRDARALESLVSGAQGVPFTFDPEDAVVVLTGIIELRMSQTTRGRAFGGAMGRVDGIFDTMSGDMSLQCHSFVPFDDARESGVLSGLEIPLVGFASRTEGGAPQAWVEAQDVLVGTRPRGGRADWRGEGRMLGTKPSRVVVGPMTGHWTPITGGKLAVQGVWAVRETAGR